MLKKDSDNKDIEQELISAARSLKEASEKINKQLADLREVLKKLDSKVQND